MSKRALVALSFFVLVGCKGKPKVIAEAKPYSGDTVELTIRVDPAFSGQAVLTGDPAFAKVSPVAIPLAGAATVNVPGVSVGKHTVNVAFTGGGRGLVKSSEGATVLTFDRAATAATLKIKATPRGGSLDITCKGNVCDGSPKLALGSDVKLAVDLTECEGCTVEIGGQKAVVKAAHQPALFDITPVVAAAKPSSLESIADFDIPVKITSKEGATSEEKMTLLGGLVGGVVFRRIAQGPVLFPGDTAPAKPRGAIIVRREPEYGVVHVVGSATTARELDLVGYANSSEQSLGSCGIYEKSTTKQKVNVAHKGITYDITMYDRRTARVLGKKTFKPKNYQCSEKLTGDTVVEMPENSEIDAWAQTFMR